MSPKFSWPREIIPNGRCALTPEGTWFKRCRANGCPVAWESSTRFPLYVLEHARHEASHPDVLVPGCDAALLW